MTLPARCSASHRSCWISAMKAARARVAKFDAKHMHRHVADTRFLAIPFRPKRLLLLHTSDGCGNSRWQLFDQCLCGGEALSDFILARLG
jgi:hypothetical protein